MKKEKLERKLKSVVLNDIILDKQKTKLSKLNLLKLASDTYHEKISNNSRFYNELEKLIIFLNDELSNFENLEKIPPLDQNSMKIAKMLNTLRMTPVE